MTDTESPPAGLDRRMRPSWRVLVLYGVLTLFFTFPLWVHPASKVLGVDNDTDLSAWLLAWDAHAIVHQPFSIFDANIYYPQRHTLAYAENLIGSALMVAPATWLTGNPLLAMNLVGLLSCFLCAVGAYLLARRMGVGPAGAVIAGLIFAFAPPRFFRIGQLHLTAVQWVPFGLAYLHAYLDGRRARDLRLAVAFFTLQVLSSGHGGTFLAIAMLALVAYRVVMGERLGFVRPLRDFGVVGLVLLLPAVLMILPYQAVQQEIGLRRTLRDWVVSGWSFVESPTYVHQFLISLVPGLDINQKARAALFPGIMPLLLAGFAFLRRDVRAAVDAALRRAVAWRRVALLLDAAALIGLAIGGRVLLSGPIRLRIGATVILASRVAWRPLLLAAAAAAIRIALRRRAPFAPSVQAGGWKTSASRLVSAIMRGRERLRKSHAAFYGLLALGTVLVAMPRPFTLWPLLYQLPGFSFIRVPSRITILGVLALAMLSGLGFDRLFGRMAPARQRAMGILVGALLVAEFAAMPLRVTAYSIEIPAIDRWLEGMPKPFAVAEVPLIRLETADSMARYDRRHAAFMLHSMAHWQKTVHGYSGIRPPLHEQLYFELETFPDETSISSLARLNVNYIVVHTELYPPGEWPRVEERLKAFSARLKLEHVEGSGRVYSLQKPGPPPAQ
jgi:hypothetical protein